MPLDKEPFTFDPSRLIGLSAGEIKRTHGVPLEITLAASLVAETEVLERLVQSPQTGYYTTIWRGIKR